MRDKKSGKICYDMHFPFPLCIAPTAFQKMAHADGELAVARGMCEPFYLYFLLFSKRFSSGTRYALAHDQFDVIDKTA